MIVLSGDGNSDIEASCTECDEWRKTFDCGVALSVVAAEAGKHRCADHMALCGPDKGFKICYCPCDLCRDVNRKCICEGCRGFHHAAA